MPSKHDRYIIQSCFIVGPAWQTITQIKLILAQNLASAGCLNGKLVDRVFTSDHDANVTFGRK